MNSERFSTALARVGDNLDRIQQLRKIAVALAIAGKLNTVTPARNPSDLLDAVDKAKADLIKGENSLKIANFSEITAEQLPAGFSDPTRFAPLGKLAAIKKGRTGIQQAKPGIYPLVVTGAKRSTCDHYDFEGAACIVPLVSSAGHGKASLNRLHYEVGKFAVGTILVAIFPYDPNLISPRFLFEYLSTFKDELLVSRMTGTANVTLTVGRIAEIPVPLVCAGVQQKVDELMGLCDRLEAARAEREVTRDRFTAASLSRLNAPDPSTFDDDARFVLSALHAVTARHNQIKYLRQTLLNLAIRGKLVPQNPNDEPPHEALRLIVTERDDLIRSRTISREKPLAPVRDDEPPFDVPATWVWTRIGEVALFTQYGTSTKALPLARGVPVLTMGNIEEGSVLWGNEKRIPEDSDELPSLFLKKLDLLYNRTNSAELVGKTGIYLGEDDRLTFASYLIRLRLSLNNSSPKYVNLAMNAPSFRETQIIPLIKKQTGQANVNGTALKNMLIPFPPAAEQHRIVAKVDELMALCDRLEESLAVADETGCRLLETLLAEALAPDDGRELVEAAE